MKQFVAGDSFELLEDWKTFKKGGIVTLNQDRFCGVNGISICTDFGKNYFSVEFIPFTVLRPIFMSN